MKMKLSLLFAALLLFFISPGCDQKQPDTYRILETPVPVTDALGASRHYRLYMPAATDEVPLMVYFHGVWSECFKKNKALKGYTGSPIEETGLIRLCKIQQIALLVPTAHYEYTFLNCQAKGWSPFDKEIDGIEKIIDAVIGNYPISKQEIYLAGISAGAVMSNHLANRRPALYNAILSHSQGYISEDNQALQPQAEGPRFGVLIGYTRGDYKDLIPICTATAAAYTAHGYRTVLMDNLAPKNHSWAKESNSRFLRTLKKLGQYTAGNHK